MGEEQSCDGALKQEVEEKWHKSKDDQVSAPLILDPTSGNMAKEMKAVSRKFGQIQLPYKSQPDLVSAVLRRALNLFMVLFLMVIATKIVGFDAKNNLD